MSTSCLICRTNDPRRPNACDPCRTGLADDLDTIRDLVRQLTTAEEEIVDTRTRDLVDKKGRKVLDRKGRTIASDRPRDPVAALLPGGPIRAATTQSKVRSHRTKPVPVNLTVVDLTLPVYRCGELAESVPDTMVPALRRVPELIAVRRLMLDFETQQAGYVDDVLQIWHRQPAVDEHGQPILTPAGDQGGAVPIAHLLVLEVKAWICGGAPTRYLPPPTVPAMLRWLGLRLDWACDNLPGIGATADTLSTIIGQARAALGEDDVEDQLPYVTCPKCDSIGLYRAHGEELIRCVTCPNLLTRREYDAHAREQADTREAA